jgi:hypothetical protein
MAKPRRRSCGESQASTNAKVAFPPRLNLHANDHRSIARFYPDRQAMMIHQSGVRQSDCTSGVEVIIHLRGPENIPVCAEISAGEFYAEIGLWFSGRELVDFDGAFSLPREVGELLREAGYVVAEDFFT